MQRKEIRSGRKEGRKFEDEGGEGVPHWQREGQMGQVEQ